MFSLHATTVPTTIQQPPKDFYVTVLPNEVVILNLNRLKKHTLLQPILEMTLMSASAPSAPSEPSAPSKSSAPSAPFFSLTGSEDELSLVTDRSLFDSSKKDFKIIPLDDFNTTDKTYRILQFHEGMSGVSHTGVVEYLSRLFSTEKVPIIYINTYNNNFILIDSNDFEKCNTILKRHNYI